MELSQILIRPIITEKTTTALGNESTYAFEVGIDANKIQIRNAVEKYFDVKVSEVRTVVQRGKTKRFGRHFGKRKNWKKAYVTLAEGATIGLFEG